MNPYHQQEFKSYSATEATRKCGVACKNSLFFSLLAVRDCATQQQKFHTDAVNQCLLNKSGSHGVPNANLFSFMFLLVDFGKLLCPSANALQQSSNASSREEYIPQILTVLLYFLRLHLTFEAVCQYVCHSQTIAKTM